MRSDAVDLTNCDREPIHIPGSIQPHGCLLALDAEFRSIRRHSANASDMLGCGELVDHKFEEVFGNRGAHDLRNALAATPEGARPALIMGLANDAGRAFDVAVHRWKGHSIVELEPVPAGRPGKPLELVRTLINRLRPLQTVDDVVKQTSRLIRALLSYDRVMVYQFAADGSGQVIAESKRTDLESFLGQHFPASDIPQQARELYIRNTIRVIGDASGARVLIQPEDDEAGAPLDLSFAHLRSVSPIHCEYLRNMGVAASMSISIVVGGELWGLIACHHYTPRALAMADRIAAEMFGDFFSLHLEALIQKSKLEVAIETRRALDDLLREVIHHEDITQFLRSRVALCSSLIASDGAGLWIDETWTPFGSTPPASEIEKLTAYIGTVSEGKVWSTSELSAHVPGAAAYKADVSGVLAVPISHAPRDYLMFFRKELVETVAWAGNPEKVYQTGPHGDRLTPRQSFAIWKETVERKSRPWSTPDNESAEAVRTALFEVVMRRTELLAEERRKADLRHKMLNEELNHRVKNILALIKSLVSQPVEEGRDIEAYVSSLKGRIAALAFAHDQVIRSDCGGQLKDLLRAELGPYSGRSAAVELDGPDVALESRAYSVMALVFHELATNAAKYGALSTQNGRLTVRWSIRPDRGCEVFWTEEGGPRVEKPKRSGFGMVLVDRSVPFDLGGESELTFHTAGVSARFVIPGRFVTRVTPQRRVVAAPARAEPAASGGIAGLNVLVLEDQLVIAIDVESMLAEYGAVAKTVATTAEAMAVLARGALPDAAVLDVHIGMDNSFAVADELLRRKIPFVFATGYGDSFLIPDRLRIVPVAHKPYMANVLAEKLGLAVSASANMAAAEADAPAGQANTKSGSQKV